MVLFNKINGDQRKRYGTGNKHKNKFKINKTKNLIGRH